MARLAEICLLTAAVVVLASELAKRSDRPGAFITALPIVTLPALVWLQLAQQPQQKIASYWTYMFRYVIPGLPLFPAFPALLPRFGFWPRMLAGILVMMACFWLFAMTLRRFDINLLWAGFGYVLPGLLTGGFREASFLAIPGHSGPGICMGHRPRRDILVS